MGKYTEYTWIRHGNGGQCVLGQIILYPCRELTYISHPGKKRIKREIIIDSKVPAGRGIWTRSEEGNFST